MSQTTEFMLHLVKQLMDEKKVAESTATAYVRTLFQLNEKKPYKNLTFLKNTEGIEKQIGTYAESTQKSLYSTLSSILSLWKDKATYKKIYKHYHDKSMAVSAEARIKDAEAPNTRTAKQEENWLTWDAVEAKQKESAEEVAKFSAKKSLSPSEYEKLLQHLILALYTEQAPRRNQDFLDMLIVKKYNLTLPKDVNYLDLATGTFIFNKYKTAKKYGTTTIEISPKVMKAINLYLKFHPLWKGVVKRQNNPVKLLVSHEGGGIVAVNAITRILNKVFGKKVGSSMLRHIYLTSKYGDTLTEQKKDSVEMAHGLNLQRAYIKTEPHKNEVITPPEESLKPE